MIRTSFSFGKEPSTTFTKESLPLSSGCRLDDEGTELDDMLRPRSRTK